MSLENREITIAFAGFRHGHIMSLYREAMLNNSVKVLGAWEENQTIRSQVAEKEGVNFNFDSYEDLLNNKEIDVIAIGDYYGIRGQRAIQALKAGKHIISDKPLCTDIKEAEEIERLAKEKGLRVYLMLDLRLTPMAHTARKIVQEGRLGIINNVFFNGQHPLLYGTRPGWYFEEGKHGGVINDIAIHGVDVINYITGLSVEKTVSARCWNAFAAEETDFLDSAQFMAVLDNGAGMIADVSYASPDSFALKLPWYWFFQIWGTEGMMAFGFNRNTIELYTNGSAEAEVIALPPFEQSYFSDFFAELNNEKECRITTEECLASTKAVLKIQKAAK